MRLPLSLIARRPKAQIAMWMLTKMAMLFFILALALVLVGLSSREKAGLCEARAEGVVQNFRSQLVGIIGAPIEDERKIIPLERVLATGSEDFQHYNLSITWRETKSGQKVLSFEAIASAKNCRAGSSLALPADLNTHFVSKQRNGNAWVTLAEPSKAYSGAGAQGPTLYVVVLKCLTKGWPLEKHLFIEPCSQPDPKDCMLSFESSGPPSAVEKCCGWSIKSSSGDVSADCDDIEVLKP